MTKITLNLPTEKELSEELIEKIRTKIKTDGEKNPPQLYWDYRDKVDEDTISKALTAAEEGKIERAIDYIYEDLMDNNSDPVYDAEVSFIKDKLEWFETEIKEELEMDDDDELDMDELARELRDHFLGEFYVDYDVKSLLNNSGDIPVRIEMLSNYDCINSDWLESQSPYEMDSYFGDMVRILQFNPADVKKMLLSKGREVAGRWPNKPKMQPLVKMDDFWQELINSSCGANLLTFVAMADTHDFLTNFNKESKITIPKGNNCGLFSHFQGGGSIIEMELQRDYTIDLSKPGYDKFLSFRVSVDNKSDNYSIRDVYGTDSQFFGSEMKITE